MQTDDVFTNTSGKTGKQRYNPIRGTDSHNAFLYLMSGRWLGTGLDRLIKIMAILIGIGFGATMFFNRTTGWGLPGFGSAVAEPISPLAQDQGKGLWDLFTNRNTAPKGEEAQPDQRATDGAIAPDQNKPNQVEIQQ